MFSMMKLPGHGVSGSKKRVLVGGNDGQPFDWSADHYVVHNTPWGNYPVLEQETCVLLEKVDQTLPGAKMTDKEIVIWYRVDPSVVAYVLNKANPRTWCLWFKYNTIWSPETISQERRAYIV